MSNVKKITFMFVVLCLMIGAGADMAAADWRPPPPKPDIGAEHAAGFSPTNPQNMRYRFNQIMQWAGVLARQGVNVDAVLPRREAAILRRQVITGNCREACPQIDRIYPQMERLALNRPDSAPAAEPPQTGPSQPAITTPQPPIPPPEPEPEPVDGGDDLVIRQVHLATEARRVRVFRSLPAAASGADIAAEPVFASVKTKSRDGSAQISVSREPTWVIEGRLPERADLGVDVSPFGLAPAFAGDNGDFAAARDLGAAWDLDDYAFAWSAGQPDVSKNRYSWSRFDAYFLKLSADMRTVKSINAEYVGKVGETLSPQYSPERERAEHRLTAHIDGPDHRRWDSKAYSRWVRAVVERYDGDGRGDMTDLASPAKHWLVAGADSPQKDEYADLLRITYRAVKDADPDAKVLTRELSLPFAGQGDAYNRETLALLDAVNHRDFDALAVEWSGESGEWRELPRALAQFRADLAADERRMHDAPLWITRLSCADRPADGNDALSPRRGEAEAAEELLKRHTVALAEGVEKIFWDRYLEVPRGPGDKRRTDPAGHGDSSRGGVIAYDAVREHGQQKTLSYWAYRKMTEMLSYWDGSPPVKLNMGPDVTAIRFPYAKDGKKGIVVIWLNGEQAPAG